jgi:alkylation response protein AidB-like acyl-CoA dehydrogenase
MQFGLSEDEEALAEAIQRLCKEQLPLDALREHEDADDVLPLGSWKLLADAGVFSVRLPEPAGGIGLGLLAAAVVFEELGRALVPGPLVGTEVAANLLGREVGEGNGARAMDGDIASLASRAGEGTTRVALLRLSGAPSRRGPNGMLVPHLGACDWLLVLEADGVRLLWVGDVRADRVERGLDPLTPLWRIRELPRGEVLGGASEARQLSKQAMLLEAALCVGIGAASLEMAVAYAKQRSQFGRPIGSFQAIKHICADMLVRVEEARCALWAACATLDGQGSGDARLMVPGASILACRAAELNAKDCLQVHGGIGFTWDMPVHLYLKRAEILVSAMGSRAALVDEAAKAI